MKTAAAYIRVSTEDQIEYSPDSQIRMIREYAKRNDYTLPEKYIFIDEGISGKTAEKRPSFMRMIGTAKMKPKPFCAILLWKFSRFARSREDSIVYKSMLRKQLGIEVISVSENLGDDKMSVLIEAMIEAMDEYYSINLAEEVKRDMTEKAKRGEPLSIPPFGYRMENKQLVPVSGESDIIRQVFDWYNSGMSMLQIAKNLNAAGVRTHRGNPIENRTVDYWLNNPVYIGKIRWSP
ncbi:MAG: recombinase family protein, partial [Oscillospiraceae bacterium]|nr:recombinase family protein [Oscillospiraceae bacterium]